LNFNKITKRLNRTIALPLAAAILLSSGMTAFAEESVSYNVSETDVVYTGSEAEVEGSYIYYKDEECTTLTDSSDGASTKGGTPVNAGTYWALAEGTINSSSTATFKLTIEKANSNVSVSDIRTEDPSEIESLLNVKVTGSTGKVTSTYYTDENCTNLTTSDNGADTDGGVPVRAGTYYVKTIVASDENYSSSSTVSKVIISDSIYDRIATFIADSRWCNGASYGFRTPILWPERASWGCCAYSIDFIMYVHGKQIPPGQGETYYNFDEVRVGDVLYQYEGASNEHYICICAINGDQYLVAEGALSNVSASVGWYTRKGDTLYPNIDNVNPTPGTFTFGEGYHFD
jgi:hypothetical protein